MTGMNAGKKINIIIFVVLLFVIAAGAAYFFLFKGKGLGTGSTVMICVEGGSFLMGSTGGDAIEGPPHTVELRTFSIEAYEVTVQEFKSFIDATGYKTLAEAAGGSYIWNGTSIEQRKDVNWRHNFAGKIVNGERYTHPVVHVSWFDAAAYCNWLSSEQGFEPVYTIDSTKQTNGAGVVWTVTANWEANGYRLPTEAEWEFAARGGAKSAKYAYSGSNNLNDVGWYGNISEKQTHPVGKLKPNELGLYDMSGNVWEWCWDGFQEYNAASVTNPKGPDNANVRIIRGGSWHNISQNNSVSGRSVNKPDYRDDVIGFRIARTEQ